VRNFRKATFALLISLALNIFFIVAIYFEYITLPVRDFYATNGITPPVKLTPISTPNYSSEAMLAPDPESAAYKNKVIPQ